MWHSWSFPKTTTYNFIEHFPEIPNRYRYGKLLQSYRKIEISLMGCHLWCFSYSWPKRLHFVTPQLDCYFGKTQSFILKVSDESHNWVPNLYWYLWRPKQHRSCWMPIIKNYPLRIYHCIARFDWIHLQAQIIDTIGWVASRELNNELLSRLKNFDRFLELNWLRCEQNKLTL